MQENAGDISLGEEDYAELRSQISTYMSSFSDMEFDSVYNFKTNVDSTILGACQPEYD